MIAALSFFELGAVLVLAGVGFFCGWAFVRNEQRRRPFEDYELREFVAHVQAQKRAREGRKVSL